MINKKDSQNNKKTIIYRMIHKYERDLTNTANTERLI